VSTAPFFRDESVRWKPNGPQLDTALDAPDREDSHIVRHWLDVLITQARCPRDSVTMLGLLARSANDARRDQIIDEDLWRVVGPQSESCLASTRNEYASDAPALEPIIRELSRIPIHTDYATLMSGLTDIIALHETLEIRGTTYLPDADGALALLAVLFEAGVYSVHVDDSGRQRGFRHIHHAQQPSLVSPHNQRNLEKMLWELQAPFRDAVYASRV
jgi:hypothetical protein